MSKFGEEIRRLREKRVMSLLEVARRCKIHVSTLSKIESGETKNIRMTTVRKLAEAFEIDPYELAVRGGLIDDGQPENTGGPHGTET